MLRNIYEAAQAGQPRVDIYPPGCSTTANTLSHALNVTHVAILPLAIFCEVENFLEYGDHG